MELPKDFKDKMINLLGDEADKFFSSLEKPCQKAITLNTSRISQVEFEKLADFELEKIELIPNGYYVNNFKFNSNIFNHLGVIYSQEPSAMYPVELLDIQKGDIVLDLCSAPGGKAIQILEKLDGTGLLVCNEVVFSRAKILYENLNRMGFKNFVITCNNPKDFEDENIIFDKILVDAPCGGEGMFRRDNFDMSAYSNANIETNAKRQKNILNSIKARLKKGGTLVYSTCTYDIQENEQVVLDFLKNNDNFKIINTPDYKKVTKEGIKLENYNTHYSLRRYPHIHRGEGQFMAKLEKNGKEELNNIEEFCADKFALVYRKEMSNILKEFKGIADIENLTIAKKGDTYFALPNTLTDFGNLNVLSVGCVIGSYQKNTFKISHNFYHTYGDLFYNKVELDKDELLKYLHGEELTKENTPTGICSVMYKGISLGGGKISQGKLKNYYPKELRI